VTPPDGPLTVVPPVTVTPGETVEVVPFETMTVLPVVPFDATTALPAAVP
jgi:hypothetical protein